jgi:hypothetical protein
MNLSGLKPVSEAIPHQTLSSYPCDCQLIDFLSFLRSLGDRRREDERADAITTCGSWRLEASKELERKEKRPRRFMQQRWNEESEPIGRSPPPSLFLPPLVRRMEKMLCTSLGVRTPRTWHTPTMTSRPQPHLTDSRGRSTRAPLR